MLRDFGQDLLTGQPPAKLSYSNLWPSRAGRISLLRLSGLVKSFNEFRAPTVVSGVSLLYIIYSLTLQHALPITGSLEKKKRRKNLSPI